MRGEGRPYRSFIEIANRQRRVPVDVRFYRRLLRKLFSLTHRSDAGIGLTFVNDRRMRRINRAHRKMDRPTDVLAFPAVPPGHKGAPLVLGDVVISLDTARRQAREAGTNLKAECCRLLIHGYLHLLGYDHERSKKEAVRMSRMERRLRTQVTGGLRRPR